MTVVGQCKDCLYVDLLPTQGACRDCVDWSNYKNKDSLWANSDHTYQSDPINPQHYKQYAVEVIDLIQQALTPEEFKGYLKGNMLKYRFRAGYKKDREEDLKKSNWYQDKLTNSLTVQLDSSGEKKKKKKK